MARATQWTCDGCDAAAKTKPEATSPPDWNVLTVQVSGFRGHQVGDSGNATMHFDLCPSCQSRLYETVNPRRWPRAAKEGPR